MDLDPFLEPDLEPEQRGLDLDPRALARQARTDQAAPVLAHRRGGQRCGELASAEHDVAERVAVRAREEVVAFDLLLDAGGHALDALGRALGLRAAPQAVEDRIDIRRVLVDGIGLGAAAADLVDPPVGLAGLAHRKPRMARDPIHRVAEPATDEGDRRLVVGGHLQRALTDDAAAEQCHAEDQGSHAMTTHQAPRTGSFSLPAR